MSDKQSNTPLTSKQIRQIKVLINQWTSKFGWKELVNACKSQLGITISRVSLSGYDSIKNAYDVKKAEFRGVTPEITKRITMSKINQLQRADKLQAENDVLKETIDKQHAMIRRMLANAQSIPNIDLNDLMKIRND